MWVHPTLDLRHPTTAVVYMILDILSVNEALERSKNVQPPAAAYASYASPAYRFLANTVQILRVRYLPVNPLIVPARAQNDILQSSSLAIW